MNTTEIVKENKYTECVFVKQNEVIDYLRHKRRKSTVAQIIEDLPCRIGLKGEKPSFIKLKTVQDLVHSKLVREMECEVIQYHINTNDIYVL